MHAVRAGLLKRHPGYNLHLVGHSMGGGVAAILAHMAHNDAGVQRMLLPDVPAPPPTRVGTALVSSVAASWFTSTPSQPHIKVSNATPVTFVLTENGSVW
jgi:thioesterase domain-containing protein